MDTREKSGRNKLPSEFTSRGHKGRGGRPKGSRTKRKIVEQVLLGKGETLELLAKGDGKKLPPRHVRIADLLVKSPAAVKVQLERFLAEQDWGKAKETLIGWISVMVTRAEAPTLADGVTRLPGCTRMAPVLPFTGATMRVNSRLRRAVSTSARA